MPVGFLLHAGPVEFVAGDEAGADGAMNHIECPACRVLIDRRSTRCRACTAELQHVHGGLAATITGIVGGLVGALRGYLSGAIAGAIVQVISGLSTITIFAIACAALCGIEGYLRRSTRLCARRSARPNSTVSIYVGDKIQVLDLRG